VVQSEYQAATEGAVLFDLSDRGQIEVAGPEARSFLHNLCTQNVMTLSAYENYREAFVTTNKARVIAHVWIKQRTNDVFWLEMKAGSTEKLFQHLNHFLISERAELANRTGENAFFRMVGPKARFFFRGVGIPNPPVHHLLVHDTIDWSCPAADGEALRRSLLEVGAVSGDAQTYDVLRIEAGLPEYGIDIDENRLAMEVNRTAQAISYEKGCYLGQETIVMARDRGQVNRLLMGVKVGSGEPLPAGTKLFRANEEVGQVTSSVNSPRLGQVIALAYLRRGSWCAGTEVVTDGRVGMVCALPFA
jgi:tRNA-modifying protein YgfZ